LQKNGLQPLHIAAGMGHIAMVEKLVKEFKVPVDAIALVKCE
jgi:ankyrin repeat protein